jgi:predicted O-methyltransferase YrrM
VRSTLTSERVGGVLARLRSDGAGDDALYSSRVRAREAETGTRVYGLERAKLGAAAPMAVAAEVGQVLCALTLAARPRLVVEFGTSLGCSTIYMASALRDLGAGRLITSEILPEKAELAERNLADAGLDDLVEVRAGDALESFSSIGGEIDLLFLDGSNDLYLPVLDLLEPRLSSVAVVVADLSVGDPHHARYRDHVSRRYATAEIPLDAGLLVSAAVP